MGTTFSGLAAADALDALLSADDFTPEHEVDTVALDATIEALAAAKALVASLTALGRHLAAAGDDETATGLAIDVRLAVETVDGLTVGVLA